MTFFTWFVHVPNEDLRFRGSGGHQVGLEWVEIQSADGPHVLVLAHYQTTLATSGNQFSGIVDADQTLVRTTHDQATGIRLVTPHQFVKLVLGGE